MGLIIVIIVGGILGWLVTIVVGREGFGGRVCTVAGAAGATLGALVAGDVPLFSGVSATQLLGAVIGAIVAVFALTIARSLLKRVDRTQGLPTRRVSGTPAPIRR